MDPIFRNEEMALYQIFLQYETAYNCVAEFGEKGILQFKDLNPDTSAFQRKFVNEIKRCDEMERKLRFMDKEIKKDAIPVEDSEDVEAPQPKEMVDLEVRFEKLESELQEANAHAEIFKRHFLEATELRHILLKAQIFFEEQERGLNEVHIESSLELDLVNQDEVQLRNMQLQLGFVTGVILRERLPIFEKLLWRVCRGNAYLRTSEVETFLEDPKTGDQVIKTMFIIFFQGEQLKIKIKKICDGFRATLYPCPDSMAERQAMADGVQTRIEDLTVVLNQTQDHRNRILIEVAKNIKKWFIKVRKIKAIYHTLNLFNMDITQKYLIAECWCPISEWDRFSQALQRGCDKSCSGNNLQPIVNKMKTEEEPPTFHRTNKFTSAFQNIVDAYGHARYGEMNPTPYTVITFPFLFAVMFGDAGHGFLMSLFALWMITSEKKLAKANTSDIFNIFFGGRYIIFFMGLFSIYTGLIYNDVFSKSLNLFDSAWYPNYNSSDLYRRASIQLDPGDLTIYHNVPYPFGIDPVWQVASNKLLFLNSYKMKMSIIYGVIHMTFGVVLSAINFINFRKTINIFCTFIPQVIFFHAIFGYLIVLVFWKWIRYDSSLSQCAPNLLITLLNMFMFSYPKKEDLEKLPCNQRPAYPNQQTVQTCLIVVAVMCVPWMLLMKPLILRYRSSLSIKRVIVRQQPSSVEQLQASTSSVTVPTSPKYDMGAEMVDQSIHTIEYCLGSISNTASYLRLWALSLAHGQLSEVLWSQVMKSALTTKGLLGAFKLLPIFAFWACATVGVLLVIEGLSAFLHALRLHWVEFQNKFYEGTGYAFTPFSFNTILNPTDENEIE